MRKANSKLAAISTLLLFVLPCPLSSQMYHLMTTLEGRVLIGGASCPAASFMVRFRPSINSKESAVVTTTRDDGTFEIKLLVGAYYVEVLNGTLPVYGRVLQADGKSRMDITLEALASSDQATCAQPTRTGSCEGKYTACLGHVESQAACIDNRIQLCMYDCEGNYHFSHKQCEVRYCNPDKGSNVRWADECSEHITRETKTCSSELSDCRKNAQEDTSK
jgi:hypothetical protein